MNTTRTEVGGNDRRQRIIDEHVDPGAAANLVRRDSRWTGGV